MRESDNARQGDRGDKGARDRTVGQLRELAEITAVRTAVQRTDNNH